MELTRVIGKIQSASRAAHRALEDDENVDATTPVTVPIRGPPWCEACQRFFLAIPNAINAYFEERAAQAQHSDLLRRCPCLVGANAKWVVASSGVFGAFGSKKKVDVCLGVERGKLVWRCIDPSAGDETGGSIAFGRISAKSFGVDLHVSYSDKQPEVFEMADCASASSWQAALITACEMYATEDDKVATRKSLAESRNQQREQRAASAKERKEKYLSTGMGMKHTAEALASRS